MSHFEPPVCVDIAGFLLKDGKITRGIIGRKMARERHCVYLCVQEESVKIFMLMHGFAVSLKG
jgi:hypothetical protein